MCSVVGYIGKSLCKGFILEGLKRLEYRGYDSAGFACLDSESKRLLYAKSEGKIDVLYQKISSQALDGYIGMGHTRWSTHGVPSIENAHPQFDCQKNISIVHNGIIENHTELKNILESSGHTFHSDTDTEIIAHLLENLLLSHQTFKAALIDLVNKLEGAYAFICMIQNFPNEMVVVRKRSPICIGIGDNEMFIASDLLAFANKTNKVLFLPDESFTIIKKDSIQLYDFSGKPLIVEAQEINAYWQNIEKNDHESFMIKEIYEQKNAISKTVNFYKDLSTTIWDNLGLSPEFIKNLNNINIFGCGTSWHAAKIAQFFFEKICLIPTNIHLASEFRYMPFFPDKNSLYLSVSQSGETADTLEALRMVTSLNCHVITITNIASSTMVREANGFLLTQAGPEIAVASTKSFSAQLTALYWLSNRLAFEKNIINLNQMHVAESDLLICAEALENTIENYKLLIINELAKKYSLYRKFIFIGRNISYPFAMEAALKLKEISYIFAQSYPAGELKHGSIALIDENTPIVIFSVLDDIIYQKLLSNAHEIKARKGHLIAFAFEHQKELINLADQTFIIPKVNPLLAPLAMTGLMQFFAYQIAKTLGRNIDQPRNLAKSVTVE